MMDSYADSISGIESGGRYDLLGPVTKSGDRAYGKYQVMGSNIPEWTKQYLGRELTPQEFLSSPQAQDAVFSGRFGQYVDKYGPEGAARAWFAGEGGMNDPNRRDQLGTSVASYGQRFMAGIGAQPTPAVPAQPAAPLPAYSFTPQVAAQPQQQQSQPSSDLIAQLLATPKAQSVNFPKMKPINLGLLSSLKLRKIK